MSSPRLRVEIDAATLLRLLQSRSLCAAELRCLDCVSKRCLWRLCLEACMEGRRPGREACNGIANDLRLCNHGRDCA